MGEGETDPEKKTGLLPNSLFEGAIHRKTKIINTRTHIFPKFVSYNFITTKL